MASKKELEALIILAGKIDPSLTKAMQAAQNQTNKTSVSMSQIGQKVDSIFKKIGKAALYIGTPIVAGLTMVAKKGIELASDLNEIQNVVDVTFGDSASQINEWSKTALKSFGLSELQAKQFSSTLGAMLKSSGLASKYIVPMSESLAGLAGDLASFYNLSQDEAFEKIRAGIAGETEPLRQLGINMTVANLQAYALSKGIKTSYDKMDQASQVALRYSYLMDKSKDAQGDFVRTQGSFANQTRLLKTSFEQLDATIMTKLLPHLTPIIQKANDFLSSIADDPVKMQELESTVSDLADSIIKFGTDAMPKVVDFANFVYNNWPTIKDIVIDVGIAFAVWKVGETVYGAYETVKLFASGIELLSLKLFTANSAYGIYFSWKIKDIAETLILQAMYLKDAILMGVRTAAMWGMTAATSAWAAITTVATTVGTAFGAVLTFITSPIGLVVLGIAALVAVIIMLYKNWGTVSAFLQNTWVGIKNAFADGVNWVVDKINWLIEKINKIPGVNIPLIPKMQKTVTQATKLQGYASGGFANQPSIFGEAGLEAAIPIKYKNPRSLSLLNQTARAIGADNSFQNGGICFTFAPVIYGGNASEIKTMLEDAYLEFEERMKEFVREQGRESFA